MADIHSKIHPLLLKPLISNALSEDWGYRDWTTDLCVPADTSASAQIICKEDGVTISGIDVALAVFELVDPSLSVSLQVQDGDKVNKGSVLISIKGNAQSILKGERVALNFLGRMSGISTLASQFVSKLEGTKTQLLDTRKSTPGLRIIEKYAAAIGGARNHRIGLSDGVLVKENHIRAAGSIKKALADLLESLPPTIKIEVETTNLDEVNEAIEAGADIIMLDNMSLSEMRLAIKTIRGRALVEASGNVNLDTVRGIAETGVDFISTGALTHSSRWADLSLLFDIDADS